MTCFIAIVNTGQSKYLPTYITLAHQDITRHICSALMSCAFAALQKDKASFGFDIHISSHIRFTVDGATCTVSYWNNALRKQATIHQVTTMLATSKNVLFPGDNHLLTTGTDHSSLISKVSGHQYWLLAGGCDLEIGHF